MRKIALLPIAATLVLISGSVIVRAQEKESGRSGQASEKKEEGGMDAWKWANFALLAFGLGYLTVKNAGPFFAARSQKIRKDMIEAEEARKDAEQRAAEVSRRLDNLDAEIAALRQQSKAEGAAESERIAQRTAAEIAKIRANAEVEIAAAGKAARAELKRYAAHLAVTLAEQKVRGRIDPGAQEALVSGFVRGLEEPRARTRSV